MSTEWRVHALGVGGSEFVYEVTADDESGALEEAYGKHGRRLRAGDISEALGTQARVIQQGEGASCEHGERCSFCGALSEASKPITVTGTGEEDDPYVIDLHHNGTAGEGA
jgi:hypothetical protein